MNTQNINDRVFKQCILFKKTHIISLLEYILLSLVIAECNSLYVWTRTDHMTDMGSFIYKAAGVLLAALLIFHVANQPEQFQRIKRNAPVFFTIIGICLVFWFINVRTFHDIHKTREYVMNFLVLMPGLMLLFQMKRMAGKPFDLLYKHADIICLFAFVNLLLFCVVVFHLNTLPSFLLQTPWSDSGRLVERCDFFNILVLAPGEKWRIAGVPLLCNYGIHTEPLMYNIALLTALFTELFLRNRSTYTRLFKRVLLTVTVITAQSTLGMILLAGAWALKLIEYSYVRKKGRKLIVLAIAFLITAAGFVLLNKSAVKYQATEVTGSSFEAHTEDYFLGLKGFLQKPLTGGGYQNLGYIHSFMSEKRFSNNRGFSNTISLVFAEGGILLGGLCLLPFFVMLAQIRSRKWKKLALWGIGPFGLYVITLFHFRIFMIFLLAFGYSLLDIVSDAQGRRHLQIIWTEESVPIPGPQYEENQRFRKMPEISSKRCLLITGILSAILIIAGMPFWQWLHHVMAIGGFAITQSPVRALCLDMVVLYHILLLVWIWNGEESWTRLLSVLCGDLLFAAMYQFAAGTANTITSLQGRGEIWENALLMGLYLFLQLFVWLLAAFFHMPLGTRAAVVSGVVIAGAAGFGLYQYLNQKLDYAADRVAAEAEALKTVTDAAAGNVYANEDALLYHRLNPAVSMSAAGNAGFCERKNATILFAKKADLQELFDAGYQVAELTDTHVLYSNDAEAIEKLTGQGMMFYRYYPFAWKTDLEVEADRNSLANENGIPQLDGPAQSLASGPYEILRKGMYTAAFSLHINPEDYADKQLDCRVCRLQVGVNYRQKVLLEKDITLERFDATGDAVIEMPFTLSANSEGIEYLVLADEGRSLSVNEISVRHTPDYITVTEYNAHRMPLRETYYQPDGEPYVLAQGYAAVEREYNLADQARVVRYYDESRTPVLTGSGYAEIHYRYNARGRVAKEEYFDTEGQPYALRTGQAAVEKKYDNYGNEILNRYLDEQGNPVCIFGSYAEVRRTYNGKKQLVMEAYFDTAGEPAVLPAGHSAFEREYDDAGNIASLRYLDAVGEPVRITSGYSEIKYRYNAAKQVVREDYFGPDGQRVLCSAGYAVLEKEYDDRGNVSSERYYDIEWMPTVCNGGYAEIRRTFNEKKQNVLEQYLDLEGKPTLCTGKYGGLIREYDEVGNVKVLRYIDRDQSPVMLPGKYATIEYEYDGNKNAVREIYYDTQGNRVYSSSQIAEIRKTYNERNLNVDERYYDMEGQVTKNSSGVAGIKREFDERNRVISVMYLNEKGTPTPNSSGVTCIRFEFDYTNNVIRECYFDENDAPVLNIRGFHCLRKEYNERRQNAYEWYEDVFGEPVACTGGYLGVRREYDGVGNVQTVIYTDSEKNPVRNTSGYAIIKYSYDEERNQTGEAYFDTDGKPVQLPKGYASVEFRYNEKGELEERYYYDLDGNEVIPE